MKINTIGHLVNVGKTNPNKPKFKIGKMNVTFLTTMNYEQRTMTDKKNKPKQTQIQNRQDERNFFENNELRTKNYERQKNKPKLSQFQTQPCKNGSLRLSTVEVISLECTISYYGKIFAE